MIIVELIAEFFLETIFIDVIGGAISKINNRFLKLRGIETESVEEKKFNKIRKRYEYKKVRLKQNQGHLKKGEIGIVLEVLNPKECSVEFNDKDIIEVKLKELLITN
jgi:hypothetical protein